MKIAVPRERRPEETRVAATAETVRRFRALGCAVAVETGAGRDAGIDDAAYREAGAEIAADAATTLAGAGVVLRVGPPLQADEAGAGGTGELALIPRGAALVGMLRPHDAAARIRAWADAGIAAFAMELMPRITRAQSMDVLSSQSNLAGYKAVLDAAAEFPRALPMMMTAAGRINPARVFVMGAGVAGLQAIATARRLGAAVSATDVRPVAREQVESLGAQFVMVESAETQEAETAGGYAREMSDDYRRRQAELVAGHIREQDIVITTALVPGRPAPRLVDDAMLGAMRAGSVIVDLAVAQGGNVEGARAGETVLRHGVRIIGSVDLATRLPVDASALYARNLMNFLLPHIARDSGALAIDWDDETVAGTCLTRDGRIVHPSFGGGAPVPGVAVAGAAEEAADGAVAAGAEGGAGTDREGGAAGAPAEAAEGAG